MEKFMEIDKAMEKLQDGMTIMIGGFLGVGSPLKCIEKIVEKGVKDLTVIAVTNSYPGGGFDIATLFKNRQVKKFITSHSGTSPEALEAYKKGEVDIEFYPMGTWTEKIRAGGAGLGAVVTPIGIGTLVEEGKEKLIINNKEYLVEIPLKADMAFIKGYRADGIGNIQYRGIALNSNPIMAMAAEYTIAEVNEFVSVGDIMPDNVGTPGIFVKAIVQGHSLEEQQKIYSDLWVKTGLLNKVSV